MAIISDYSTFLTKLYILESALKFISQGRWPIVNSELMVRAPRSPTVVDLLRHLPYIDEKDARNVITNVHHKSDVIDRSVRTPEP